MKWEKLGRVFCVDQQADWMMSHTANPYPEHLRDDVYRVYFSCRDQMNRSSITYLDFDVVRREVVARPSEQVLAPGILGTFDDSGCSIACIVDMPDGKKYMYYMGWCLSVTVPWRNTIGLAVCDANSNHFARYSQAPIMGLSDIDPFTISYPAILQGDGIYRMWYGSNTQWGEFKESMNHVIKYAESEDGIHWTPTGRICVRGKDESEYAFARLSVVHERGIYKMWYSYRGELYRIGYAESRDGYEWTRMDEDVGIDVSEDGWDSEMIEYPSVFDHHGRRYMFYSGNAFGKTGFGVAVLVED
jgi:hypothetical protein